MIAGTSKGINDVVTVTPSGSDPLSSTDTDNLFCFDLKFDDPKAAIWLALHQQQCDDRDYERPC